jgi:hypothetical protein
VYSFGNAAISTPEICPVGKTPEAWPTGSRYTLVGRGPHYRCSFISS